jgi:hypothetical protein
MTDPQLTTVFRFVCVHCSHVNDYEHRHPVQVQPHLISSRCASCQTLNWLGGLRGTVQGTESAEGTTGGAAAAAPEGVVPALAAAPETV